MEETIQPDSQHPPPIVSNLTTVPTENNGTTEARADFQSLDGYEPDSKCEMTTLERAYYEPPTTNEQDQEQEPDNGACNLNQTSFDPQVIEDYVERGGCQQFIQNLDNSRDLVDATTTLENTKDIIDSTIESFDREMLANPSNVFTNLTSTNPIQSSIGNEEQIFQLDRPEDKSKDDPCDKSGEKPEHNLKDKLEDKPDEKSENKLEEISADKPVNHSEEKPEDKSEVNPKEKSEDKPKDDLEDKLEDKSKDESLQLELPTQTETASTVVSIRPLDNEPNLTTPAVQLHKPIQQDETATHDNSTRTKKLMQISEEPIESNKQLESDQAAEVIASPASDSTAAGQQVVPSTQSDERTQEFIDECAERDKLVQALTSTNQYPDILENVPQEGLEKQETNIEMKMEEPIQSVAADNVEHPVEEQNIDQSVKAIEPEEPLKKEVTTQQEKLELFEQPLQPEKSTQPKLLANSEKPVEQEDKKDDQEKLQEVHEEPVKPQESSTRSGRSRRSSSKTDRILPTRVSRRHQPQELQAQPENPHSQTDPLPSTDLITKQEASETNGAESIDETLLEPQKPVVTRKRLRAEIDSKTPDDKPREKLSSSTNEKFVEDSSRKFQCRDCGYSTDRLNNIVYHKKNSCQHLKQSWDNSVKNYISGLVKSPKSNKKRRLR